MSIWFFSSGLYLCIKNTHLSENMNHYQKMLVTP